MLLLMFRADGNDYAIDARRVVEVVPRVSVRPIPHAPEYLLGLLSYRGHVAPVIDFGRLTGGTTSAPALSTRVIIVELEPEKGRTRLVGLVAEDVSRVVNVDAARFDVPSMALDEARYLGAVLQLESGLVQLVAAEHLLSDRMRDSLFGAAERSG